ncbi:MAG: hypothetical protein QM753_07570 [Thermomicrobiales bacterium]
MIAAIEYTPGRGCIGHSGQGHDSQATVDNILEQWMIPWWDTLDWGTFTEDSYSFKGQGGLGAHGDRYNYLFLDGHVECLRPEDTVSSWVKTWNPDKYWQSHPFPWEY